VAGLWAEDDIPSPVGTGEGGSGFAKPGEGRGEKPNLMEKNKGEVSKQIARSFVLLTTAANPSVAPIHDRMPFIVRDDQFDQWLNDPQQTTLNSQLLSEAPLDWYLHAILW
jgi:putative SOS response-associated peptidase YedK